MDWRRRFIRLTMVGKANECWPWQGHVDGQGYGQFRQQRLVGAHVAAHEFWLGPVPEGHEVDHVTARGCVRKDCTNPRHLEAVLPGENLRRQHGEVCGWGHERATSTGPDGCCRPCRARRAREGRARAKLSQVDGTVSA